MKFNLIDTKLKIFTCLMGLFFFVSSCGEVQKVFITDKDIVFEQGSPIPGNGKMDDCEVKQYYIPDTNNMDHTPMRYVRVNFHYFIHPKDLHPMNEDLAIQFTNEILKTSNYKLSLNAKMNLPVGNKTPVIPIRYRYVLAGENENDNGIYVHLTEEDEMAYYNNTGKKKNMFSQDVFKRYGVRKNEVLNIFFFSHPPDSINAKKKYNMKSQGVGFNYFVKMGLPIKEFIQKGSDGLIKMHAASQAGLLNHEIGHSLGLAHTWNSEDGCEDTPKHPNCWNRTKSPPCNIAASNNMMDYNATKAALTPCQISKVMYNMATDRRSQRNLLDPRWCNFDPSKFIRIAPYEVVEWKSSRDLEGDIIIEEGAELHISCTVSMPKGAKIVVKPGGILNIKGGMITNLCGDRWEGVLLYKNKKQKGTVIVSNDGSLQNMVHKVDYLPTE
ncbi:MAG: hypothetical protein HKN92_01380 [Chitinophagales bacterium]|nr:hypothetical protein [Chitinophagales bacterium]